MERLQSAAKDYPMQQIPGGEIRMRDDRKQKQWDVSVVPFLMGTYPVTQQLYYRVTKKSPSTFGGSDMPVESVSWLEAVDFCNQFSRLCGLEPCYTISAEQDVIWDRNAFGYRLPTEVEWEYACRAGSVKPRYENKIDLAGIPWFRYLTYVERGYPHKQYFVFEKPFIRKYQGCNIGKEVEPVMMLTLRENVPDEKYIYFSQPITRLDYDGFNRDLTMDYIFRVKKEIAPQQYGTKKLIDVSYRDYSSFSEFFLNTHFRAIYDENMQKLWPKSFNYHPYVKTKGYAWYTRKMGSNKAVFSVTYVLNGNKANYNHNEKAFFMQFDDQGEFSSKEAFAIWHGD